MYRVFAVLFAVGCTAAPSSHTGAPPPHTGGSTILDSAELAPGDGLEVYIRTWEWDRQCWASRLLERPAEHWERNLQNQCPARDFEGYPIAQYYSYSDPGGHCIMYHDFQYGRPPTEPTPGAECLITDPFYRPCEDAPGCCDDDRANHWIEAMCSPFDWQP